MIKLPKIRLFSWRSTAKHTYMEPSENPSSQSSNRIWLFWSFLWQNFKYTLKNPFLNVHKSFLISLYKPNLKTFHQLNLFMAKLNSILKFHSMKVCVLMMLTSTIKLKNSLKLYGLKEILLFGKTLILLYSMSFLIYC